MRRLTVNTHTHMHTHIHTHTHMHTHTHTHTLTHTHTSDDKVVRFLAENYDLIVASDTQPTISGCLEPKIKEFADRIASFNPHARVLVCVIIIPCSVCPALADAGAWQRNCRTNNWNNEGIITQTVLI